MWREKHHFATFKGKKWKTKTNTSSQTKRSNSSFQDFLKIQSSPASQSFLSITQAVPNQAAVHIGLTVREGRTHKRQSE